MSRDEILKRYPNASESFIQANLDTQAKVARLYPDDPKPVEGDALVSSVEGKETRWYGPASRFEITFHIYSVRPPDWDGADIKFLQDFLVHASVIPGDGWRVLSGRVISHKVPKGEEEKTEIVIEAYD